MDNLTQQLLPASIEGISVRVRNEVISETGRRIALHEYPNSNDRFVEDLGKIPPRFRVEAFVHGNNFKQRSDQLRSILDRGGLLRVIMPTFGSFNVYALPYTVNASQTEVGEIKFSLEFAVGRPAAGPARASVDLQDVYDLGDQARETIQEVLASDWQDPDDVADAAVGQYDYLQSINQSLDQIRTSLPTEELATVLSVVQNARSNTAALIRSGSSLAGNMIGALSGDVGFWQNVSLGIGQTINELRSGSLTTSTTSQLLGSFSSDAGNIFDSVLSLVNYGNDLTLRLSDINGDTRSSTQNNTSVPLWTPNTASRIRRNENRLALVNATRLNALVASYEVAAAQDYGTISDIVNTRQTIEAAHEQVMRVETSDQGVLQSNSNIRRDVENLRIASLNVLSQKRQSEYETLTIMNGSPRPSVIQAYSLYAENILNEDQLTTRTIDIRGLNPSQPSISLNGDVTVLRS